MAVEYIALEQTVEPGANIIFAASIPQCGGRGIRQRAGSGLIEFRGTQCKTQFVARFAGNIAIPADGTVGEISAAITLNGEALAASEMVVTPAAVEEFWNISTQALVDDMKCCENIAVRNTSDQPITLRSGNLIVS